MLQRDIGGAIWGYIGFGGLGFGEFRGYTGTYRVFRFRVRGVEGFKKHLVQGGPKQEGFAKSMDALRGA